MRFLLNPVRRSAQVGLRQEPARSAIPSIQAVMTSSTMPSPQYPTSKAWGQQCAPDCGCVVRFEATIDDSTKTIVDATYQAKSVVVTQSTREDEKTNRRRSLLRPVYTTRNNKPMLQKCKCNTVHTLASEMTDFIVGQNLERIRNQTQFSFTRSSSAFRHAVLVEHKLPRSDTQCFDVVEEAFTGMIKGYIPLKRRDNRPFDIMLASQAPRRPVPENVGDEDEILAPSRVFSSTHQDRQDLGEYSLGMDETSFSLSSPRSMSSLTMFDLNAES